MNAVGIIGGYDQYVPIPYIPAKIGLAIADIKVGMNLTNQGKYHITVWNNPEGTGARMLLINPGAVIGLVTKIEQGAGGPAYRVHSDAISKTSKLSEIVDDALSPFLPESSLSYGYVLYRDLKFYNAIPDKQIVEQKQTLLQSDPPSDNWIPGVPNIITVGGGIALLLMAGSVIKSL